jgi:uncharacterized protein (TIGR03083 family)
MTDMWQTVAAEREALANDLDGLSEQQWETTSLCDRWTVRDVVAHMTSTAHTGPGGFFTGLAKARFKFDGYVDAGIARHRGGTPAETLAGFRAVRDSRTAPPGPKVTWLGETVIHAEDVRRPLGLRHEYPADAVRELLDFFKGSNAIIGTRKRIEGLTLVATDMEWSHGTGPRVEGPALELLLAGTGRAVACAGLTGDGVETLRSRC